MKPNFTPSLEAKRGPSEALRSGIDSISDKITHWIGSTSSILLHTFFFALAFASHWLFGWAFDLILLILTTIVSLEAIYLAIFIQRAVTQQGARLHDVEETLDDVEESIDEVEESIDEIEHSIDEVEKNLDEVEENQEDLEEDIADIADDTAKKLEEPIDEVVTELKRLIKELQKSQTKK